MPIVSEKGWVVIPAELRRKYGIEPGDEVIFIDYGGVLSIMPAMEDPIRDSRGILAGGDSLTEALFEERARDRGSEDRR